MLCHGLGAAGVPDSRSRFDPDILAAFDALGVQPASSTDITTLPSTARDRGSFRVTLADGGRVKAVLVESADRARAIARILDLLRHRHFPRVLARHGRALVTEWIDGTPLSRESTRCSRIAARSWARSMRFACRRDCLLNPAGTARHGARSGVPDWTRSCRPGHSIAQSPKRRFRSPRRQRPGRLKPGSPIATSPRITWWQTTAVSFTSSTPGVCRATRSTTISRAGGTAGRSPTPSGTAFSAGTRATRSPSAFKRHFAFWMVHALVDSALFRLRNRTGAESVPAAALVELVRGQEISSPQTLPAGPAERRIFFASDLHLGAPGQLTSLDRERQVVAWLDLVQHKASDLFLLGDLFDFWFEYKTVVPRGHTRVLGRLAALADAGVRVHVFAGNHDRWLGDYLATEMRAQIYREPQVMSLCGRTFYLAHGDPDTRQTAKERLAASALARHVLAALHPDVGISIASSALGAQPRGQGRDPGEGHAVPAAFPVSGRVNGWRCGRG